MRLVGEPDGFARALGVVPRRRGDADVIVLFARDARELSVCAIDDTWSSLRFVVRVADRS
ncbi:MAG TPA: hypothetical protein VI356_25340 [Myxococcales bacterium]